MKSARTILLQKLLQWLNNSKQELKAPEKSGAYTETYRSGHNGTDSKSVVPHGTVGSNPTVSAKQKAPQRVLFCLVKKRRRDSKATVPSKAR